MKKLILATTFLQSIFAFSQCTITGADTVQVGERQTYTAANADAACENCYTWIYMKENIILENESTTKDLTVKGARPGTANLSLEIKTNGKVSKCEKLITVIAPTTSVLEGDATNCVIAVEAFKEVRTSNKTVVFEPETTETNFTYNWTIYYRGGEKKQSSERKPQFDFSDEHVIDKVDMEVVLGRCSKKVTKEYNTNFWYFF